MRQFITRTTAVALLLFASGCAAPGPANVPGQVAGELPVWPQPPAEPRIRYVRSVSGPRDLYGLFIGYHTDQDWRGETP